jgi:hypothetical protein
MYRRWSDVFSRGKRLRERRIPGQVRHDPELDLRVVGGNEHVSGRGDERFADAPAFRGSNGNVLQVGIGACQSTGDRGGLGEVCMHATGA